MNDETLRIAQVRQMRKDFHVVDQLLAGLQAAFNPERHDRSLPLRQILLREREVRTRFQPGILHPRDRGMLSQPFRYGQRVRAVRLHAEFQRLDSLEKEEGIERADTGPKISQALDPYLDHVRQRSEDF